MPEDQCGLRAAKPSYKKVVKQLEKQYSGNAQVKKDEYAVRVRSEVSAWAEACQEQGGVQADD